MKNPVRAREELALQMMGKVPSTFVGHMKDRIDHLSVAFMYTAEGCRCLVGGISKIHDVTADNPTCHGYVIGYDGGHRRQNTYIEIFGKDRELFTFTDSVSVGAMIKDGTYLGRNLILPKYFKDLPNSTHKMKVLLKDANNRKSIVVGAWRKVPNCRLAQFRNH